MKITFDIEQAAVFFKNNWFTCAILVLALYIYFKKDLRFSVSVQSPDKLEQPGKQKEKITDHAAEPQTNLMGRVDLPFIRGNAGYNALAELAKIDENTRRTYLKRFIKVAYSEKKRYNIPASVILGTALYHSCAGKRELTLQANNHFALPCGDDWSGPCEAVREESYRRYETAWESFRDFSIFVEKRLSRLKGEHYQVWAKGLEELGFGEGFATDLVRIIETYELQELD
jgi:flagellum-specific peptidoglycan hydrolase FlgJ